jgi:biotin carboxylase
MEADRSLAIVLGGTHPHVALIENLKARNYRVLLADYLESPPAARFADEHLRVSTLSQDAILSLARERNASLVIATCVDRANVTAAYVAGKLRLPAPYDFATAELIANKLRMKNQLVEIGIPTARFCAIKDESEIAQITIPFPVVTKPTDMGGSKGVRKATTMPELRVAAEQAFEITRTGEILIEEFLPGVEVSADCMVVDGEAHILVLRRKYVQGGVGVLSTVASVSPACISPAADERIRVLTNEIARGFGLRTTPLLVQFMVHHDEVHVIEFAPRIGGGLNFRFVKLKTGIDLVDLAVDSWLGKRLLHPAPQQETAGFLATIHIYSDASRFGELRNHERLLDEGIILEAYIHKTRGAPIGPSLSSADRAASFIVRADSEAELSQRVRETMERLDVVDVDGRSILRREVTLH